LDPNTLVFVDRKTTEPWRLP